MCNHLCLASQTLPPSKHNKLDAREASKVDKKHHKSPKYRAEPFPSDSYASGDELYFKFCQHNVVWKCIDVCKYHWQSKALLEKCEENLVLHTLFIGQMSVKCK